VTAVEGDRVAADDLAANAAASGTAVVAVHQPVELFLRQTKTTPRLVIVDPPRTGLSRDALDGVLARRAQGLIYVSCDVATLARDARRIADAGYELAEVQAFDLFPNTPHVETVVQFVRG
jgi:23S rRNA (uracil1939-C5)-methyltransferase